MCSRFGEGSLETSYLQLHLNLNNKMCKVVFLYIIFSQFRRLFRGSGFSNKNDNCLIDSIISQKNEIRGLNIEKEVAKLSLVADDIIMYLENLREST